MLPLVFGVFPSYGLFLLLAYFVGSEAAVRAGRELGLPRARVLAASTLLLIAAVLGARVAFLLEQPRVAASIVALWRGGLTFVGSVPAVALGAIVLGRVWRMPLHQLVDPLCHAAALGQAIGRVGCFLAGCCYGLPSERFGLHFAAESVAGPEPARFPIQLVEAVLSLALFSLLRSNLGWLARPYRTLGAYLVGLATIRLVTEPFRGDQVPLWPRLTVAQGEALVVLVVGLLLIVLSRRDRARASTPSSGSS